MKTYLSEITGHLDIIVANNEEEFEGITEKWQDVLIHGDPERLRSLAKLLIKLADLNQEAVPHLPTGAREHIHLQSGYDLSKSSVEVIVGRLDAKGEGGFYSSYIQRQDIK